MKPLRRFYSMVKPENRKRMVNLPADHPAFVHGHGLFQGRVFDMQFRVLKDGINNRKIGSRVTKGRWAGMPIYTLTLEERATCPRSCQHWGDCYGNNMHLAHRQSHGEWLEQQLERELKCFQHDHPKGFVVRLHVLGDFYSDAYVMLWYRMMLQLPALHVFGFTAWAPDTGRGKILMALHHRFKERWWIRFSHADHLTWLSTGETGITCPMQQDKTDCCGTCGLCWTAKRPIHFIAH